MDIILSKQLLLLGQLLVGHVLASVLNQPCPLLRVPPPRVQGWLLISEAVVVALPGLEDVVGGLLRVVLGFEEVDVHDGLVPGLVQELGLGGGPA